MVKNKVETLYLIRHGETLFNKLGKIQGVCDSPLTKKGIENTKIVRNYFLKNKVHFDQVYCSTQERACDTVSILTSQPYIRLKGLKEHNCGLMEGENGFLRPQSWSQYRDFYIQFGGESFKQFSKRITNTLKKVMQKAETDKPGGCVLAVSHGGVMGGFLRNFLPYKNYKNTIRLKNNAILKLTYSQKRFNLLRIINLI